MPAPRGPGGTAPVACMAAPPAYSKLPGRRMVISFPTRSALNATPFVGNPVAAVNYR